MTVVAIQTGLAINSDVLSERTPPSSFRRILASLLRQTAPGVPVVGLLRGGTNTELQVVADAGFMRYTVRAGFAVTSRAGHGAYLVGSHVDVVVPTAAAHATLPRLDRLYIVQPDPEQAESGVARIDVVNGLAASEPTVPALPTGALEIGRKRIEAGATNTLAGSAITNRPAYTALNGVGIEITASQITDQQNINAGRVNGVKITSSTTEPVSPAIGDLWYDYS